MGYCRPVKIPRTRCTWPGDDPLYVAYHDNEWGVVERNDRALFEKLLLDGFQAGLSWIIVLRKRPGMREAFCSFDPDVLARWGDAEMEAVRQDPRIIRNRAKIKGAVTNARAYLGLRDSGTTLNDFLWQFTDHRTLQNRWQSGDAIPAETPESRAMARALKAKGFKFCGPTICYAFMQAIGMVNDHVTTCFRYQELGGSA